MPSLNIIKDQIAFVVDLQANENISRGKDFHFPAFIF
jgi:hypothetical protein